METWRILHTNDLHSHFEHFPKIGRYLKKRHKQMILLMRFILLMREILWIALIH